jgi:hypothetical protein
MRSIGGMAVGVAGLVFAGSAVVFGSTVVDAVLVEEVQVASDVPSGPHGVEEAGEGEEATPGLEAEIPDPPTSVAEGLQGSIWGQAYPQVSNDEILAAVNQDVFQPDRTPPMERYLLPSERSAPVQSSRDDRRRREPDLRIVGTALAGDLALALVQPDDSIPFAVLLGESVDGYLLAGIDEESVTLTRDGEEFTYPVVEPQRARSSNDRNRNSRNQATNEAAAQALTERVQQMLQGLQRGQMMRGGGQVQRGGVTDVAVPIRIQIPGATTVTTRARRPGGGGGEGGILP